MAKTSQIVNLQQNLFLPNYNQTKLTQMNQISDESFLKSVRNRIRQISIKSFNERPRHWHELKTQIIQSPVRDSLIHEALSQVRTAIRITKNCGENHPDTQLVVDPIFLEQ